MDGRKNWKHRLLTALGSAGLLVLGGSDLHAELLHSAVSPEEKAQAQSFLSGAETEKAMKVEFVPHGSAPMPKISHAREDWRAVSQGLRADWEALTREMVATTVTMFFIRGGTPPPKKPADPGLKTTPPKQPNDPPGGGGAPPGPQGNGESPPPGGPNDPPAVGAPEPSSIVIALVGASLAAGYGWRKRRRST
jgi:hypothetical protein